MASNRTHTLRKLFHEVEALIRHGWCQGTSARNKEGTPVFAHHPDACQWCLSGAISKAAAAYPIPIEADAVQALSAVTKRAIISWNDTPGRTVEEVLQVIQKATPGNTQ